VAKKSTPTDDVVLFSLPLSPAGRNTINHAPETISRSDDQGQMSFHPSGPSGCHGEKRSFFSPVSFLESGAFHNYRQSFPSPDTETGEPSTDVTCFHRMEQSRENPCTGGTDRVAQRDGSAVDVHLPVVET